MSCLRSLHLFLQFLWLDLREELLSISALDATLTSLWQHLRRFLRQVLREEVLLARRHVGSRRHLALIIRSHRFLHGHVLIRSHRQRALDAVLVEPDEPVCDSFRLTKSIIQILLIESNGSLPSLIVDSLNLLGR